VAGWAASADKRRIIQLSSSWLRFGLSKVRLKLFRRRGFKLTRSTLMFTNCYLKILQNLVHNGKVYLSELSFNRSKLCPGSCVFYLPITDPIKKSIAQQHRLHFKICRDCGSRNSASATKCRKCRGHNLRWKKRELVR
jgi:large subunit ribosomal protein L40e